MTSKLTWLLLVSVCVLPAACGGCSEDDDQTAGPGMWLVGVNEGSAKVYYEYWAQDDWEIIPSAVWSLDLTTGESRRIQRPVRQASPQVEGDYLVTQELIDDLWTGRVVATQISTGQRWTIVERDLWKFPHPRADHVLDGERVLVLSETRLLLYDLPTRTIIRTIELPEAYRENLGRVVLVGFKGDHAVLMRPWEYEDSSIALVDTGTGELVFMLPLFDIPIDSPSAQGIWASYVYDDEVYLSTRRLVFETYDQDDIEDDEIFRGGLLMYDISVKTWTFLEEPFIPGGGIELLIYWDTCESYVVLLSSTLFGGGAGVDQMVLMELESSDHRIIAQYPVAPSTETFVQSVMLTDSHAYWVRMPAGELSVYEIESGQLSTLSLSGPFAD